MTFRASLKSEDSVIEVTGEQIVFGFVLHYGISLKAENHARRTIWNKWSISEPTTGFRVTYGASRKNAMDNLAWLVALHGGTEKFEELLRCRVEESRVAITARLLASVSVSGE